VADYLGVPDKDALVLDLIMIRDSLK